MGRKKDNMRKMSVNPIALVDTTQGNNITIYAYIAYQLDKRYVATTTKVVLESKIANGLELTKAEELKLQLAIDKIAEVDANLKSEDIKEFVEDAKEVLASDSKPDIRVLKIFANNFGYVPVPDANLTKIHASFVDYVSNGKTTKPQLRRALSSYLLFLRSNTSFVKGIICKPTDKDVEMFVAFMQTRLKYDKKTGHAGVKLMSGKSFAENMAIFAAMQYDKKSVTLATTPELTPDEFKSLEDFGTNVPSDEKIKSVTLSLDGHYSPVTEVKVKTSDKVTRPKSKATTNTSATKAQPA